MTTEKLESIKPSSRKFLTLEEWLKIKSRYLAGDNTSAIARDYKVCRQTIWTNAKREGWVHGSRKAALDKKIADETEGELIVEYKVAVKEANKKHLEDVKLIEKMNRDVLEFAGYLLKEKFAKMEKFIAEGKEIPSDFSILEEAKIIGMSSRNLLATIGRNESEILGIVDKPMLVDDPAERGMSEMSRVIREAAERIRALDEEEKVKIRAEVMAEIKEAQEREQGSHPLQ